VTGAAFLDQAIALMEEIRTTQGEAIEKSGRLCAEAIREGGLIHVFGTGHSHILAEEVFARAGGLLPVNAILVADLMLHEGGLRSGPLERLPGLAGVILDSEPARSGDVMIVASNSGRNAVPVEMAELSSRRGLRVVAITSLRHSRSQPSLAPSGKRLFEVADVVIDNRGLPGDAILPVPGGPEGGRMAATSTVTGAAIVQAIMAEAAAALAAWGVEPPIMMSANLEGSAERNERLLRELGTRVPSLLAREVALRTGGPGTASEADPNPEA
jgi:uncharacterized phosphosugar-binding protein